ncbi:MAG: DUF308 domain-containing protein [Lachnospiraceae bacterium]|nr:DUF308 domain-containing protein [Lachnospiraceae bacterium]
MAKRLTEVLKQWWLVLILGIISVILAFILIANPGTGFNMVRIIGVINFITIGILGIVSTIARRKEIPAWGWNLVGCILILLLGIFVACNPLLSDLVLIYMFTFAFIFEGVNGIFGAFSLKDQGVKGWGWSLAFAIITVILGILLVGRPLIAALSIDIIAAAAMLSFGISMIVLSIQMSKAKATIEKAVER